MNLQEDTEQKAANLLSLLSEMSFINADLFLT